MLNDNVIVDAKQNGRCYFSEVVKCQLLHVRGQAFH